MEEMKKALSDNDTHIQLSNLERRWQVIKREKRQNIKDKRIKDKSKPIGTHTESSNLERGCQVVNQTDKDKRLWFTTTKYKEK